VTVLSPETEEAQCVEEYIRDLLTKMSNTNTWGTLDRPVILKGYFKTEKQVVFFFFFLIERLLMSGTVFSSSQLSQRVGKLKNAEFLPFTP